MRIMWVWGPEKWLQSAKDSSESQTWKNYKGTLSFVPFLVYIVTQSFTIIPGFINRMVFLVNRTCIIILLDKSIHLITCSASIIIDKESKDKYISTRVDRIASLNYEEIND